MRLPLSRARARLAVIGPAAGVAVAEPGAVLSALPVACALVDADNRFRYANPAAEQFFAQSIAQLRHLSLGDLVAADSPLFGLVEQVRAGDVVVSDHDLSFDGPRLQRRSVTVQGTPVPEEAGLILLTFQDESAARTLDRQLNFRSAARSVAGMAAILAHEVKNPLSGIRGAAQLLENTVGEADRELAVLIRDEADRIRALVERMEAFGEKPVVRDAVNIHRVLEHVKRLAQSGFAAHLRITELYDPSLPPVMGNRDQLGAGAAESGEKRGRGDRQRCRPGQQRLGRDHVDDRLPARRARGRAGHRQRMHLPLVVTVRDSGPGIPADIRDNLFDPFVTTKPTGTGLGLALAAKIIGEHGGLMEVDSRRGRTDFRLFLPILQEDRPSSLDAPPSRPDALAPDPSR